VIARDHFVQQPSKPLQKSIVQGPVMARRLTRIGCITVARHPGPDHNLSRNAGSFVIRASALLTGNELVSTPVDGRAANHCRCEATVRSAGSCHAVNRGVRIRVSWQHYLLSLSTACTCLP